MKDLWLFLQQVDKDKVDSVNEVYCKNMTEGNVMEANTTGQWVMSYRELRRAVGIIGIALPLLLVIGKIIIEQKVSVASSISSYFYTVTGGVLVGSLCAIGVFLYAYRGPERADNTAGNIAGLAAIGVALFPTSPEPVIPCEYEVFPAWVPNMHLLFASIFFLTLAYFCLKLFVKTNPNSTPTPQKIKRNRVYKISGYVILACIVLILISSFLSTEIKEKYALYLIFESVAVFAFGFSWMVKGEALFKDC